MRSVPSDAAEQSMAMIMRELVEYRQRRAIYSIETKGRMLSRRVASASLPPSFATIVSIVSVAEEFFASTLRTKVESSLDTISQILADAESELTKKLDQNWNERRRASKRWFGVDMDAEVAFLELMAFVEARNAIAHGLGRLTRRQLGQDGGKQVAAQLSTVGIVVLGGEILVDEHAVARCASAARSAVEWSDRALQSASLVPIA